MSVNRSIFSSAALVAALVLAVSPLSTRAQQSTPAATLVVTETGSTNVPANPADPLGGATSFPKLDQMTPVTLVLDYTPNTNHLGIYAAQALGYYADANLNVTIQQVGDVATEQLVGTGKAEFGVSYQDVGTFAIASGQPIVSIAAIIQHNTSAFASFHDKHPLKSPADLAGLRYGSFDSPIEHPTLDLLAQCYKFDSNSVQFVDAGNVDPFPLMTNDRIDFTWLFYGWDGIRAQQQGLKLDFLYFKDFFNCIPDYYTPTLITNATEIAQHADVVKAFTQATARGYAYAIQHPDDAAALLLKANPDLDQQLVKASAEWLAGQFQADAPRWGQQQLAIWQTYTDFLVQHKAIDKPIDVKAAFTNDYLPGTLSGAVPNATPIVTAASP